MGKKAVIIGAGVGGLATAARLSCRGYQVEVFEKLPECGGRAHMIEDRGFKFDTDPSLASQGRDILYILAPVPNLENVQEEFTDKVRCDIWTSSYFHAERFFPARQY